MWICSVKLKMRIILLCKGSKMLFRATSELVDLSRPKLFDRIVDFLLAFMAWRNNSFLRFEDFVVVQTFLFYVWICWVFSDPPRVKGLDPHSDLPPFSLLPLFFPPVVTFACFPCPSISWSNPVFCPYPPLLFPSISIPPLLSSPPLPGAMWHT